MIAQSNPLEPALSGKQALLDLPLDHRRVIGRLGHSGVLPFTIAPDLARQLVSLAERESVSLSSVYLAAYAVLLSRYGNVPEVSIGSSIIAGLSPRSADASSVAIVDADCAPDLGFLEFLHTIATNVEAGERHCLQETAHTRRSFVTRASAGAIRKRTLVLRRGREQRP